MFLDAIHMLVCFGFLNPWFQYDLNSRLCFLIQSVMRFDMFRCVVMFSGQKPKKRGSKHCVLRMVIPYHENPWPLIAVKSLHGLMTIGNVAMFWPWILHTEAPNHGGHGGCGQGRCWATAGGNGSGRWIHVNDKIVCFMWRHLFHPVSACFSHLRTLQIQHFPKMGGSFGHAVLWCKKHCGPIRIQKVQLSETTFGSLFLIPSFQAQTPKKWEHLDISVFSCQRS